MGDCFQLPATAPSAFTLITWLSALQAVSSATSHAGQILGAELPNESLLVLSGCGRRTAGCYYFALLLQFAILFLCVHCSLVLAAQKVTFDGVVTYHVHQDTGLSCPKARHGLASTAQYDARRERTLDPPTEIQQTTTTATTTQTRFMVAAAAAMAMATAAEVYLWRVLVVVVGWRAMNKVSQSIDQIWCVAAEGVTHCLRQARQAGVAAVMLLAGGARRGGGGGAACCVLVRGAIYFCLAGAWSVCDGHFITEYLCEIPVLPDYSEQPPLPADDVRPRVVDDSEPVVKGYTPYQQLDSSLTCSSHELNGSKISQDGQSCVRFLRTGTSSSASHLAIPSQYPFAALRGDGGSSLSPEKRRCHRSLVVWPSRTRLKALA
ncbi:hypothetical protein Q7P36_005451 [Cladosporium allicinum]